MNDARRVDDARHVDGPERSRRPKRPERRFPTRTAGHRSRAAPRAGADVARAETVRRRRRSASSRVSLASRVGRPRPRHVRPAGDVLQYLNNPRRRKQAKSGALISQDERRLVVPRRRGGRATAYVHRVRRRSIRGGDAQDVDTIDDTSGALETARASRACARRAFASGDAGRAVRQRVSVSA